MSDHPFPSEEEIAVCAYLIAERDGFPPGREQEFWHQAESQLRGMLAHEEATRHAGHAGPAARAQ